MMPIADMIGVHDGMIRGSDSDDGPQSYQQLASFPLRGSDSEPSTHDVLTVDPRFRLQRQLGRHCRIVVSKGTTV